MEQFYRSIRPSPANSQASLLLKPLLFSPLLPPPSAEQGCNTVLVLEYMPSDLAKVGFLCFVWSIGIRLGDLAWDRVLFG